MRRPYIKPLNNNSGHAILICLTILLWSAAAHAVNLPTERHPALLFDRDTLPLLKERILRAPYNAWWTIVQERAAAVPSSFAAERDKARYARSLAFEYIITNQAASAQQTLDLLQAMKFPPRGGDLGEPHFEGEALVHYVMAYDMVHEYAAANDPAALDTIRTILAEEAQYLYEGIEIKLGSGLFTLTLKLDETPHIDNWHLRVYGALGLAAFALADHPGLANTPQDWADHAFDMVQRTLDFQIEDENGGFAEGPFYARYAADVYLPYLIALKRLDGTDHFADPKVRKLHDWLVGIRLPDGRRPNIDDAHLSNFYGHYLTGVEPDGGVHRWDWENNVDGLFVRQYAEMDAIALYDDQIPAQEPSYGPTLFFPGAGDAIFRSDWSDQAVYLLLRGEHDNARQRGLSHEHPDETSFILAAGGEILALDAGYINFDNHFKVNQDINHNLILVDGKGPPLNTLFGQVIGGGNDAYIEDYFSASHLDYAQVRAAYQDVDLCRHMFFVDHTYFIVADQMRDDQAHTYTWQLHGHGHTSTGAYQRQDQLARWTQAKAELIAYMPTTAGMSLAERDGLHSFAFLQEETHTVLEAEQSGANSEFLAVLYPQALNQPEPAFSTLAATGGQALSVALNGTQDIAWVRTATATLSIEGETPLSSDGEAGWIRLTNGQVAGFSVQDGLLLRVQDQALFSASAAIDLSLEFIGLEINGLEINGYVGGPASAYQLSLPAQGSVDSVSFNATTPTTQIDSGLLTLDLAGSGSLFVRFGSSVPVQAGDFDDNGAVNFADFFLFAEVFGQTLSNSPFDLNDNGTVDFADFFLFAERFGQSDN